MLGRPKFHCQEGAADCKYTPTATLPTGWLFSSSKLKSLNALETGNTHATDFDVHVRLAYSLLERKLPSGCLLPNTTGLYSHVASSHSEQTSKEAQVPNPLPPNEQAFGWATSAGFWQLARAVQCVCNQVFPQEPTGKPLNLGTPKLAPTKLLTRTDLRINAAFALIAMFEYLKSFPKTVRAGRYNVKHKAFKAGSHFGTLPSFLQVWGKVQLCWEVLCGGANQSPQKNHSESCLLLCRSGPKRLP